MKYTADELASKLEEKAKGLREKGLTEEDMELASGGHCHCCGSTCTRKTDACTFDAQGNVVHPNECARDCVGSSPD